jgi:hypothetical protein
VHRGLEGLVHDPDEDSGGGRLHPPAHALGSVLEEVEHGL